MNPEQSLWHFIGSWGQWFWHVQAFAAFVSLFFLLRLSPSRGLGRGAARVAQVIGLFLVAISSTLNGALGPIGFTIFLAAFAMGTWLRMRQHIREGIDRPVSQKSVSIRRDWQNWQHMQHSTEPMDWHGRN